MPAQSQLEQVLGTRGREAFGSWGSVLCEIYADQASSAEGERQGAPRRSTSAGVTRAAERRMKRREGGYTCELPFGPEATKLARPPLQAHFSIYIQLGAMGRHGANRA